MRIKVTGAEKNLSLILPTSLIFSDLIAVIGAKVMVQYLPDGVRSLDPRQLRELFRVLRQTKRKYGSWELVDVQSSDGSEVKIIL